MGLIKMKYLNKIFDRLLTWFYNLSNITTFFRQHSLRIYELSGEISDVQNRLNQIENRSRESEKSFESKLTAILNTTQKIQDEYHRETYSNNAKLELRIKRIERLLADRFGPSWHREPLLDNEETTSREGHDPLNVIPVEQEFDPALLEKVVQQNKKLFGEGIDPDARIN